MKRMGILGVSVLRDWRGLVGLFAGLVVSPTLPAATYEWTGGGDGKSLYAEANWAEVGSGKKMKKIEVMVAVKHDLLIEKGRPGGDAGFKPYLCLGGRTLTVRGGQLRGSPRPKLGGGIQTDDKKGGSRSTVVIEGGKVQVAKLVDILVKMSGDAELQLTGPLAPLKNSIVECESGFSGVIIFTRKSVESLGEAELGVISLGGRPVEVGKTVEVIPAGEKGCVVRMLGSRGAKPPEIAAKGGETMKPPSGPGGSEPSALETGPRTWTDVQGRKLLGEIAEADEAFVVVVVEGKPTRLCLGDLSKTDRDYVLKWRAGHGAMKPAAPVAAAKVEEPPPPAEPAQSADEVMTAGLDAAVPSRTGPPADFPVETVIEDAVNSNYVYATPHFEFKGDRRLTSRVISGFSLLYEATYEAVRAMPWSASLDPGKKRDKFEVRMFSNEDDYIGAGGKAGSAGVAMGSLSLVQMKHLGVRDTGSRLILEDIEENHVLIHELTHALRDHVDRNLPTWAVEGAADYVASAPYQRTGKFDFDKRLNVVAEYLAKRRGISDELAIPMSLEKFWGLKHSEFYGGFGEQARLNYSAAVLIYTWLWHADRGGDGQGEVGAPVRAWAKALLTERDEGRARSLLLDGRTHDQIEEAISHDYRRMLKLSFK